MRTVKIIISLIILAITIASFKQAAVSHKTYFMSLSGDDNNNGSKQKPWKTIDYLNSIHLLPGDSVCFNAGEIFSGNIFIDSTESGTTEQPIVFTSYGSGNAVINAGNTTGLTLYKAGNVHVNHLSFNGNGRKEGNTKDGIAIINSSNVAIDSVDIKGFQKAGLLVYASQDIRITNVYAHENGFAGISVSGYQSKSDCNNIYIGYCRAENNPGDPTNFDNHSGNGIIAGLCKNVTIEYSTATNNGWDMPRIGNGPVGIWCYEADSVTIQHCISYRNKTAPGAADGGGFDLDGGVTNSVIQYCLSYENEGSAFGLFQYAGASNWYNNTIRFNISENDGAVSPAHAAIFVWNSSRDTTQLKDCFIYNNTIYNDRGAAISYEKESEHSGFYFYNNIFVAKDLLITGKESTDTFLGNNWWSINGGFNMDETKSLSAWAKQKGKEQLNNKIAGLNINPRFPNRVKALPVNASQLLSLKNYQLPPGSLLQKNGIDLHALFGINTGTKDFNQHEAPGKIIGACL